MSSFEAARDRSTLVRTWLRVRERVRSAARTARVARLLQAGRGLYRRVERTTVEPATAAANASRTLALARVPARWVRASHLYRWLTAEPSDEVVVVDLRETLTLGWLVALLDRLARRLGPPLRSAVDRSQANAVRVRARTAPLRAVGLVLVLVAAAGLTVEIVGGETRALTLGNYVVLALLGLAGLRSRASWDDLRDGRLGRTFTAALEPPSRPESKDRRPEQSTDDTSAADARSDSTPNRD